MNEIHVGDVLTMRDSPEIRELAYRFLIGQPLTVTSKRQGSQDLLIQYTTPNGKVGSCYAFRLEVFTLENE